MDINQTEKRYDALDEAMYHMGQVLDLLRPIKDYKSLHKDAQAVYSDIMKEWEKYGDELAKEQECERHQLIREYERSAG